MDLDIERALQHAIGQANSVFITEVAMPNAVMIPTNTSHRKRKNGKKRTREDTAEEVKGRKDKKQKKTHDIEGSHTAARLVVHQGEVLNKAKANAAKSPSIQPYSEVHASTTTATDLSALMDPSSCSTSSPHTAHFTSDLTLTPDDPQAVEQFPTLSTVDHPIPQLNSNEDILRAFQELDLTRLAGVLRSLDVQFSPSQSNAQPGDELHDRANVLYIDQTSSSTPKIQKAASRTTATSSTPSGRAYRTPGNPNISYNRPTKSLKSISQANPNIAIIGPSVASPEHTHLLANKWLSASKLKSLVATEGLVYKKGKFSAMEDQGLKTAIDNYRVNNGLTQEQLLDVIFSKSRENTFWCEIAASVPARPITAVYHHIHRTYHPLKYQGRWLEEEDVALIKAVAEHGQAWQKVSEKVGRMAQDCRDRWKNHLANRCERRRGQWTREEEEELTRIVSDLTTKQGRSTDNDIFWGVVSQRMGNKRSRQQCRIKWTDCLSKIVKSSGNLSRWSKRDSLILVQKVASLDVRDDTEIDWKALRDPDWNIWSAHSMQRRWRTLRFSIKGHETMTFRGIVEILQHKYHEPFPVGEVILTKNRTHPRKEPKSSELIQEDEDDD